jgi:hypothetical protein
MEMQNKSRVIHHDETPNFYFMQYELATWRVKNLLLVPSFAFPPSAIIKRKPLSSTARRAGWVGCNIALNRVPAEARIPLVITRSSGREPAPNSSEEGQGSQSRLTSAATVIVPETEVREKFRRVKPLKDISVAQRGWTLDVLNIVRRLVESRRRGDESLKSTGQPESLRLLTSSPTNDFTTADAYAFTRELEKLHPDNPVNYTVTRGRPRK